MAKKFPGIKTFRDFSVRPQGNPGLGGRKLSSPKNCGDMLSVCERRVCDFVVQGLSNREIGEKLCVTEKTIKFHLTNIYKKENVTSRVQLIVKNLTLGMSNAG